MTNTMGNIFKVSTFGSSHGKAIGALIDGCPANLELNEKDIQKELDLRRPGTSSITTSRHELDKVEILSGIFEGKTDGTPILALVFNKDNKSKDYSSLKNTPRPAHGDYTWKTKFGNYDYNGGGRGSGRVTIGHVIGGAIALKILEKFNIKIISHVTQVGDIKAKKVGLDYIESNTLKNSVRTADLNAAKEMEKLILGLKAKGDSVGGVVETIAIGVPPGVGNPIFEKLDGEIAKALMNIGSVKGVELGFGFDLAKDTASKTNDEFYIEGNLNSNYINPNFKYAPLHYGHSNLGSNDLGSNGKHQNKYEEKAILATTNTSGGILGGISNGMPIVTKIAVKPTPSISLSQNTVDLEKMENTAIEIKGRHDPCICPRITAVSKSVLAIVILDGMLRGGFIPLDNLNNLIF
ncbi:chorismate synthase [Methanobrevibacter curvatus]|uniref:Chorismate synthase n=1 Tax=Methanobrevibacter curvatus TaxID=49547 RepID=A0A162FNG4_9EURY|nr:chorismate synthase [Methanobrevibacter curvatus]KZX12690.1 chorismate synthase [Methanobrevibacter curvatus]